MFESSSLPTIKPIYPVYRLDSETFRIGAQIGITAEFHDPDATLWTLVSIMDGRTTAEIVQEMTGRFPDLDEGDVLDGINLLHNEGFVEDGSGPSRIFGARLQPNISYFSHFSSPEKSKYDVQNAIKDTNVLLLGLGGGGSNILTLLAGIEPKSITAVDYDRVEEGNLGRQFIYREHDIGTLKTTAAANALAEMNSNIAFHAVNEKIESPSQVTDLLHDNDIAICAIDEPPFKAQRIVNKACILAGKPCVYGASQVSHGRVFTIIPEETGCFDCLNIHYSQRDPQFLSQFEGFAESKFDPPSIAYGPAMFTLSATIVDEVVRTITSYAPPRSHGLQLEVDYEDGSQSQHPSWPRFADLCPTCGAGDESQWPIFSLYG